MTAGVIQSTSAESATGKRMRSVEASRAVWQSKAKLTRSELLVLQALASHANENLECYPSLDRLAGMSRLSKRQTIRIIDSLHRKGQIAVTENAGGRSKCNHYRLLVAENSDIRNSDTRNSDKKNGDSLNTETVTVSRQNSDILHANGDIAMSPEWIEWFSNGKTPNGGKALPLFGDALAEIEEEIELEELMRQILQGPTVQRNEVCEVHGPFVRTGYRWRHWIAWSGQREFYGPGWSHESGCLGCLNDFHKLQAERLKKEFSSVPVRRFDLRTPVTCPDHGDFILLAILREFPKQYAEIMGRRFEVGSAEYNNVCPGCEQNWLDRCELQEQLGLSDEEWERGGKRILEALTAARNVSD